MKINLNDLSIAHKISVSALILLIPTLILGYFLVIEKDELIQFTNQEIAGVHYIKAAQAALYATTSLSPSDNDLGNAASELKSVKETDKNALGADSKTDELVTALQSGTHMKSMADAVTASGALITLLSDNSNITLDPDGDAYFVGDILVNQITSTMTQANALYAASQDLATDKSDDHKIAFAEARDGIASAVSNATTDMTKALKNNTTGSVKDKLEIVAKKFNDAADTVAQAAKKENPADLKNALQALLDASIAFNAAADEEMEILLKARNAGFHQVIYSRLSISIIVLLLGMALGYVILRSVTNPLKRVTSLLREITLGNLDIEIPHETRADEVGSLTKVLEGFHQTAIANRRAQEAEHQRFVSEQHRTERLTEINRQFSHSITEVLRKLKDAVAALDNFAHQLTGDSQDMVNEAVTLAENSERTAQNVDAVASASEELSVSIREIASRVAETTKVSQYAASETSSAKEVVANLSATTNRISEVVTLIHDIASQTNLLALNATIEAARAGEAGKGFAVVASEVKALAGQTAKATDDITNHISAIQTSVQNVTSAMDHIDNIISQLSGSSTSIASAVEEQGAATQEISRNASSAADGTSSLSHSAGVVSSQAKASGAIAEKLLEAAKRLEEADTSIRQTVSSYLDDIVKA